MQKIKRLLSRTLDVIVGIGIFAGCGVLIALTAALGIVAGLIFWVMNSPLVLAKCFLLVMLAVLAGRLAGVW